jgi:RND superfamily putative drug exporter
VPEPKSKLLRHPRRVALAAVACLLVLGVFGRDAESRLVPSSVVTPGTESSREESQAHRYFGDSAPFVVLLRGPAAALDRQGPGVVRELRRDPAVTTLSPWDPHFDPSLRPHPGAALIVADFHVGIGAAVRDVAAHLEERVDARVSAPVRATATGFASFLAGTKTASDEAGQRGELIALPILLVVLLLVFRSPLAAFVPIAFGVATVIASRGVIAILSRWIDIDPVAPPVASMMGLALGVDYALLMVSRFREELGSSASAMQAAAVTRRTAGRTILIAGSTLFCSLLAAFLALPKGIFTSVNGAVVLATALSVLMAWTVGPAVLTLLGANVNRWRLGGSAPGRNRWMTVVRGALRRPGPTAVAIAALMLVLAAPILSLTISASGLQQLPASSKVRRDAALIDRVAGPGWGAPFVVVASTEKGSIAGQGRLDAIRRWQQRIAADPAVETVIGPGQIAPRMASLRRQGDSLIAGGSGSKLTRASRLGPRLAQAAGGVSQLRDGLARGSQGAGLLGAGSARAATGAQALAAGAEKAAAGGKRASDAIGRLSDGTRKLVSGQRTARFGALQLELGLSELLPNVAKDGLGPARSLQADLARRAAAQPELREDAERAADLTIQFARAKREVRRLHRLSTKLYSGLSRLAGGGTKLQSGVEHLSRASRQLGGGLERLGGGSRRLAAGVSALSGGAGTLQSKLAEGFHRSYPLQSGLRRSSVEVGRESGELNAKVGSLRRSSPGLFDSGYFALSVLDGAPAGERRNAGQIVDLGGGGKAARMLVIADRGLGSADAAGVYSDLRGKAAELGRETGLDVAVGGGTAQLIDYGTFASGRLPLLILLVTAVTYLMLVVFLRSLLLPAIAVLLNLVTVAVSLGVLALVTRIPAGYPLGGNRILDIGAAMSIFSVAFSLSIDYAVFLVTRMRESYEADGDSAAAVYVGLEKTARVVTGAAIVMGTVFMAYASAPLVMMSQVGVGLAVAVLLDATVIRIVLLPALMLLVGERVWWLPAPLARLLPRLEAG